MNFDLKFRKGWVVIFIIPWLGLLLGSMQSCKRTPRNAPGVQHNRYPLEKQNIKILILGNSITQSGPDESVGWHGNWGMAASAAEKDYVHILKNKLDSLDANISIEILGVGGWERNFGYDFTGERLTAYKPDILIVRLGENIPKNSTSFEPSLIQLIDRFKSKYVIITGSFWPAEGNEDVQYKVAVDHGYDFVDLSELWSDDSNRAYGRFENKGVSDHPSDIGMQQIANRIFIKLRPIIDSAN